MLLIDTSVWVGVFRDRVTQQTGQNVGFRSSTQPTHLPSHFVSSGALVTSTTT
ncbi:hypothetical protein F7734_35100 [Scytonema sp. UIC 10036]|uniref:hypothetical protein n=1 Tax=Scytonema sp. UIC 10036 TaxID=2304196 RepID=UPI0012DA8837|nr:hypothetical protein [Scytonema sp. UIC 10036]MUG97279.1 hypothetical protein [Scytonema sp. UIC 10036]